MISGNKKTFAGSGTLMMVLVLLGAGLLFTGCARDSGEATPAEDQVANVDPVTAGKASYAKYCQSCHGADGKGSGELGTDLASAPADLTQLAIKYNGFPVDSVYKTIDGRADVEAHGPREMPVWANIWSEEDGERVPDEVVERRINELIEYIRSIQEEPAEG